MLRNATMAWISVSATMMTARTAAVRTGSAIRRRAAGSSCHNGCLPVSMPVSLSRTLPACPATWWLPGSHRYTHLVPHPPFPMVTHRARTRLPRGRINPAN